jgi:hypothetical protein
MRFEIQVHTLVSQPQKVSNAVEWQGVFVAVVVKLMHVTSDKDA